MEVKSPHSFTVIPYAAEAALASTNSLTPLMPITLKSGFSEMANTVPVPGWTVALALVLLTSGGCAVSGLPPVGRDHPAHPDAEVAAPHEFSAVLAIDSENLPVAPPEMKAQGMHGMSHDISADADPNSQSVYTCPMHPQVRRPAPGKCPICAMPLAAVKRGDHDQ